VYLFLIKDLIEIFHTFLAIRNFKKQTEKSRHELSQPFAVVRHRSPMIKNFKKRLS
jgi:hypothetical protein